MILVLLLLFGYNTANCQTIQSTGTLLPFAYGLIRPLCIVNAGDSRLFVADQHGYIHIIDSLGNVNSQAFLDIHDRVTYGTEQGLLGVAFHPQYISNPYFYVNYIGAGDSTHISRFTVDPGNPDVADPNTELKLMTIYQPFSNHNGGNLCFGPDGYLYIGMGDGGWGGDPGNRAQNLLEYLGKMMRIDVNNGNTYTIPPSNPFYNSSNALGEIWALGLRNPWRFSFDRLTGDLWIGDVGESSVEEIDMQPSGSQGGENYGWKCYEGNQVYDSSGCQAVSFFSFPVYSYLHNPECSVTGGYVFRGDDTSMYYGYYFFADYCSDKIWTLHKAAGNWVIEDYGQFPSNNFSSFGEDSQGRLYIAGLNSGTIYRITGNASGITNNVSLTGIKIIQYPSSNRIRIETGRNDHRIMHITLNDVKGSILFISDTRESTYEFDPGKLSVGTYLLNIVMDGKHLVHKLVF